MHAKKSNSTEGRSQARTSITLEEGSGDFCLTGDSGSQCAGGATIGSRITQSRQESLALFAKSDNGIRILGIDPGNIQSAYVILDGSDILASNTIPNQDMLHIVHQCAKIDRVRCAIEMIQSSYGMPVGKEVFNTVFWIGRFFQTWVDHAVNGKPRPWMLYRIQVKKHFGCGQRGKDKDVRFAIIKQYGGTDSKKNIPAELKGISGDQWSALAVAITRREQLSRIQPF